MEKNKQKRCGIFYHASHEQFSPRDLLGYAKLAEQAGFDGCHSSDHFHPWGKNQGHSGYVYSWLGSLLEATQFPASFITTPGQRYHPAVVAQGIATLAQMYPGRLGVELGSGEPLNEHITGAPWPEKAERDQRLLECARVIRRLLAGEKVDHEGLIRVHEAKLYTLPAIIPPLNCAGLTATTARWAGTWADGFVTVGETTEDLRKIISAFRETGGDEKPITVKMTFSYARDKKIARDHAFEQWRTNCIPINDMGALTYVEDFERAAESVSMDDVLSRVPVSNKPAHFSRLIQEVMNLGVDTIVLHNVCKLQEEFIEDFGAQVLPEFR